MTNNTTDEDYIPPKAIDVFARQIPGNKNMPIELGWKCKELSSKLLPIENLPEQVQNIITSIRSADSIDEKAAIAHSFSQSYIKDVLQYGETERNISFEELANDPFGDCDDHQQFTAGLLIHGGVNPRSIFMLDGLVAYQSKSMDIPNTPHAFIVVKNEDDQHLLLDNMLTGVPLIDPTNPIATSTAASETGQAYEFNNQTLEISAEIIFLSHAEDGRGATYENQEAQEKLDKHSEVYTEFLNKHTSNTETSTPNTAPSTPNA